MKPQNTTIGTLLLCLLSALVAARASDLSSRVVLPTGVRPVHYDIDVAPHVDQLTFDGSAKIEIEVSEPTNAIVMNALDLSFDRVALDDSHEIPSVSFDVHRQTATLLFATQIAAGAHVLTIDYKGKINRSAAGMFALDYDTVNGKKRALFTQFENADARRFIPSWDEPAQKATFTFHATVPRAEMALSNMPISSVDNLPGGMKRVHFMPTPKMSCYLLYFGSGDFERVARTVNGVDVGIVVKRGDTGKAQYALDTVANLLPYYEDYFAVKYPLPKLDLIAAPGSSQFFGAMENWGAILYFEQTLLIDPVISTQSDRRGVYTVVAHEVAHQWFGDLVTMDWWEDLWLNEGFASWMSLKAIDHSHPEWLPWLRGQGEKDFAMRTDSRKGTHAIIQPISDVLQANQAFDEITYSKSEAVIRMLENYVGETAFRDGVRNYLQKHAYGNTVSNDLWIELDKTAAIPVSAVAHDFTRQAGVPLVTIASTRTGARLTQSRFSVDGLGPLPTRWRIPIVALALESKAVSHYILTREAPLDIQDQGGVVINAGQAGYFRTLYAPSLMRSLVARFGELSPADQLGLLNDSSALGYAGNEPLSDFLALAKQAQADLDPTVLRTVTRRLREMDALYEGLPGQRRIRAFGRHLLKPILLRLGWIKHDEEPQNLTLLRAALLVTLSKFDDEEVIAQARAYFADYMRNPTSMSVDLRSSVLAIVAEHSDEATWQQIHSLAKSASSSLEQQQLYTLLGTVRNRELANRALRLALSDEVVVTTRPQIIVSVSETYPDMAFEFASAHLDQLMAFLEPDSRLQFLPLLAGGSVDAAMVPKLHAYAAAHIPADARSVATKSEAQIAFAAVIRRTRLAEVDRWLQAH